jgi:D-alanine transaminase
MVFLNGRFLPLEEATIPVLDRGFLFGDGVYELVPVYSRVPFRLEEHLARLERSLGALSIRNPYSRAQWREHVHALVDKQSYEDQGLYFQVTRGVAKRDHAFPRNAEPTVFMMANPLVNPSPALVESGAAAVSAQDNRWLRCDIKSISLVGNVLLRQLSAEVGAAETILLRDGQLTEASASSAHVVRDGRLATPPQTNAVLPGTTRGVILELAAREGIASERRPVAEAELRSADELLIASAGGGIRAVTTLDGKPVGNGVPGPVYRKVYAAFKATQREFSTELAA